MLTLLTDDGKKGRFPYSILPRQYIGEIDTQYHDDDRHASEVQHSSSDHIQSVGRGQNIDAVATHVDAGI